MAVRALERLEARQKREHRLPIILYRKMLRDNMRKMQLGEEPMDVFRDPAEAARIKIVTERDKTQRFGGPPAKYSPITPHMEALFAQARGIRT